MAKKRKEIVEIVSEALKVRVNLRNASWGAPVTPVGGLSRPGYRVQPGVKAPPVLVGIIILYRSRAPQTKTLQRRR